MNTIKGFTLIEVLIAMLVLAVGLLGLASLQAYSLRNTQSAYNRSLATELAYDLADRMRANMRANILVVDNYTNGTPARIDNCKKIIGCSTTEMVQNDLYESRCAVAGGCENDTPPIVAVLPGGVFSLPTVVGKVYTITVSWSDWDDFTHDVKIVDLSMRFQLPL